MPSNQLAIAQREMELLGERYPGRPERAFLHWALGCLLSDVDPGDDALTAHTAIDGPRDLGLDGYWIDETNNRLILSRQISAYG